MLLKDLYEIESALKDNDYTVLVQIHKKMEGKYHNRIKDFESSLWCYNPKLGFSYELLDIESIKDNLQSMKYKIEGYLEERNINKGFKGDYMNSFFKMEKIKLEKRTGEIIEDIHALVEPDMIFIEDARIIIDEEDIFIRSLPNGIIEYYLVLDRGFYKGNGISISDHYQTKVKKISKVDYENLKNVDEIIKLNEKPTKIFISHSSKDEAYVRKIVELLEDLNVPEDGIFCSSIPEYGIPGGEKIYEYLREQFETYNLHIIFILSDNYYNSITSMNEMGAAWALHNEYTTFLMPGFDFSLIKGVLDPTEIATKLDDSPNTVKARLNEFKDKIEKGFNLNMMNINKWERKRDEFMKSILNI